MTDDSQNSHVYMNIERISDESRLQIDIQQTSDEAEKTQHG
jgi:hypothetical protein